MVEPTYIMHYLAVVFNQVQFDILSSFTMIGVLQSFNHLFPCPNATFQESVVECYLAVSCPFKLMVFFDLLQVKNENINLRLDT